MPIENYKKISKSFSIILGALLVPAAYVLEAVTFPARSGIGLVIFIIAAPTLLYISILQVLKYLEFEYYSKTARMIVISGIATSAILLISLIIFLYIHALIYGFYPGF